MTCAEFDAALPDYLEGTLDEPLRAAVKKHLSECVRCASLVKDLEKITKDAAALPDLVPSHDLWQGIEARITAPVIPLAARPERQRRFVSAWMGVAAAALVVSTAGITYMLTARSLQGSSSTVALGNTGTAAPSQTGIDTGASAPSAPDVSTPDIVGTRTKRSAAPSRSLQSAPGRGTGNTPLVSAVSRSTESSDVVYGREIANLQRILTERKSQLDPGTVAIIERNLRIIDAAIAQSRAALANDPASRLLGDQLTHALDKKVELLRTAALLPAST
jgi:hypothetical protein